MSSLFHTRRRPVKTRRRAIVEIRRLSRRDHAFANPGDDHPDRGQNGADDQQLGVGHADDIIAGHGEGEGAEQQQRARRPLQGAQLGDVADAVDEALQPLGQDHHPQHRAAEDIKDVQRLTLHDQARIEDKEKRHEIDDGATFMASKPVRMGVALAKLDAANAPKATGGVIYDSIPQ